MPEGALHRLTRGTTILKFIQIVLLSAMLAIAQSTRLYGGFTRPRDLNALGFGISIGYLTVTLIIILSYIIGDTTSQESKFELVFYGVGALLFLVLGIPQFLITYRLIRRWRYIANGAMCVVISICQLIHTGFLYKGKFLVS